jgi:diphthamide synthase (EF-2-diphthine--ammonia ligase)
MRSRSDTASVQPRPGARIDMKRTLLSCSSGKDSACSLFLLRQQNEHDIVGLLTTFNQGANRVAMHAVRRKSRRSASKSGRHPFVGCRFAVAVLECRLGGHHDGNVQSGYTDGDRVRCLRRPFLSRHTAYREKQLENSGLQPIFPVWGMSTRELANSMIKSGVRAKLTCVDPNLLAPEFVGREFDEHLLSEFPPDIDPCGENGEFHTFVYAGPMFQHDLSVDVGEIVSRDGFVFADLTLAHHLNAE